MIEALYNYYLEQEEPGKSCLLALRTIILKQDEEVTETRSSCSGSGKSDEDENS